jgi:prepilin-type N-terminal cleavage/methylation domain-containing protein
VKPRRGSLPCRGFPRGDRGFTLVETLVSLVLLSIALAVAALLLQESARTFAEVSRDQRGAPAPLLVARIRADVLSSASVRMEPGPDGSLERIVLEGHPTGRVAYRRAGSDLVREVLDESGQPRRPGAPLWRGVRGWSCRPAGPRLLRLEVRYDRPVLRPGALGGPRARLGEVETAAEVLYLAPRAAGLGEAGW